MSGRRYRGHRRASFVVTDLPELVEFRARQRTFHGAYSRTALGNLGYSVTILRLFDQRFHKIGLLFVILSGLLFIISLARAHHSYHDFADQVEMNASNEEDPSFATSLDSLPTTSPTSTLRVPSPTSPSHVGVIQTMGQENTRVFGRPFITAGWIVVAVTGVVAAVEIGLLVLILQI